MAKRNPLISTRNNIEKIGCIRDSAVVCLETRADALVSDFEGGNGGGLCVAAMRESDNGIDRRGFGIAARCSVKQL